MLPSLGCFSVVECPFFNGGVGQCSRPYCHYRHVKRDPNAPPEPAEDVLGPLPVVNDVKIEDTSSEGTSLEQASKSRAPIYRAIVDAAPTYNPTPIAVLKSAHLPIPYTPTAPTRSSAVKKSKPSLEYVPHCKGSNKPSYPPYCPSSISGGNPQSQSAPLDDPLKNPLYEIYGPEGAQYSPNDVDPLDTGYSYAPTKSASYAPYSPQYAPYCPQYVPASGSNSSAPPPQFSPPDSQPSDDDDNDNVDLAVEAAAQTNGSSGGAETLIDLDLSELDNLEFEFEDDEEDATKAEPSENNSREVETIVGASKDNGEVLEPANTTQPDNPPCQKSEKRRSSGSSSSIESKRLKSSHENEKSNDHKERKHSSSSSSKKSTNHSSHEKKSSSHSSSKTKAHSSSSSSSKSGSSSHKKSHSSDSKSKSSSSSRDKDRHRDKEKEKDRSKDKHRDKDKLKDKEKDRHSSKHRKKSSHKESSVKDKSDQSDVDIAQIDDEIRMVEAELNAALEDEDTIEQQCYEMFSEFSEAMQTQQLSHNTQDQRVKVNEDPTSSSSSKKRIAHQASHSSADLQPKPIPTLAKKCSPYQAMRDRWELLKNSKLESIMEKPSLAIAPQNVPRLSLPVPYSATNSTPASLPSSTAGKKKIASVPNVSRYLKPPPQATSNSSSSSSGTGTTPSRFYNQGSQRVDEFGRLVKVRVAHAPNMDAPIMKKPVVNPSDCRKFKVATRQANVNKLYQAYLDAGFGEEAHDMALESERTSSQGTESLGVYSHRIIQILKDLRACAESSQNGPKLDGLSGIPNRVVSHNAMLAGKLGAKVSWSIESSKKDSESKVSGQSLYEQLLPYVLTKEQLVENGFPVPSGEKGVALLKPTKYRTIQQPSDPRQHICVRCLKPYSVDKKGNQVKEEECLYHSGRKFTTRRFREAETRYTCCDGTGGYCSVSQYHVFETSCEKNGGYMSTISKPWMDDDPGVYALDCEMCYTTAGLELTRVTVIKENLSIAYESLVKPAHKILDYNTKFSGITEEDLKNTTTTILQVQATLLGMFCDKTILVGHSLESDLKALKLIHPTVVDTSIVFPHKMGPPQKRALRTLAGDYLKKIIQSDVGGHDSKEDAVTAMELMLWKLKEDEKTR